MMEAKSIFASRTVWATLIAFVATMAGAFGLDLGLDADTQAAIVGGIMAVVSIVMRAITKEPVKLP